MSSPGPRRAHLRLAGDPAGPRAVPDAPGSPSARGSRTPQRTVRVDSSTWEAAGEQALLRSETVSAAINRFLRAYAAGEDPTSRGTRRPI